MKVRIETTTEVDTDNFTPEEWKQFILKYVPMQMIIKAKTNDLFYLEYLKEKAIQGYNLCQEFEKDMGL